MSEQQSAVSLPPAIVRTGTTSRNSDTWAGIATGSDPRVHARAEVVRLRDYAAYSYQRTRAKQQAEIFLWCAGPALGIAAAVGCKVFGGSDGLALASGAVAIAGIVWRSRSASTRMREHVESATQEIARDLEALVEREVALGIVPTEGRQERREAWMRRFATEHDWAI